MLSFELKWAPSPYSIPFSGKLWGRPTSGMLCLGGPIIAQLLAFRSGQQNRSDGSLENKLRTLQGQSFAGKTMF